MVLPAKRIVRLIFTTVVAECVLWCSRLLLRNYRNDIVLSTKSVAEKASLLDEADLKTGAFANCSDHRGFLNASQPYDGQLTISCHTFGYRAPVHALKESHGADGLQLLVGVLSNNATMRQTIRETWGSALRAKHQVFFLVANQDFKSIEAEYEKESDLLWLDMENNYYKLTYMTSAMLTIFHRHATYTHILKTDDDCYVHVDRVMKYLEQLSPSVHYLGHMPQLEPLRDTEEVSERYRKYILSREDYPFPYFAPYAAGPGYIVTPTMNECVVREISMIRYMPFEDVFVGLLAERCGIECYRSNLVIPEIENRWGVEVEGSSDKILVQHHMTHSSELMKAYHKNPRGSLFQQSVQTGASASCSDSAPNNSPESAVLAAGDADTVFGSESSHRRVVVSCRKFTYKAPLEELNITRPDELLYLVLGSRLEERQAVRKTWATRTNSNHSVYFVIHAPRIKRFREEFRAHRDLIWIQTTKRRERVNALQAAMQVVHKHGRFRYLVVVNSKTYVYPDRLQDRVTGDVFGPCSPNPVFVREELRNEISKGVTPELYPEPFAPPKCATRIGYAMSESLVACAAKESAKMRYHPMETMAMGMLALRCGAWTVSVRNLFLNHPGQESSGFSNAVMVGNMMDEMMQG